MSEVEQHLSDEIETVVYKGPVDDDYQGNEIIHRKPLQRKKKKKKHGKKKLKKISTPSSIEEDKELQKEDVTEKELPEQKKDEEQDTNQYSILKDEEFNHVHLDQPVDDDYKENEPTKRKQLNKRKPAKKHLNIPKLEVQKTEDKINQIQPDVNNTKDQYKQQDTSPKSQKVITQPITPRKESTKIDETQNRSFGRSWLSPRNLLQSPKFNTLCKIDEKKEEQQSPKHKEKKVKKSKKHQEEGDDPMITKQLNIIQDNERSMFSIANSIGRGAYGEVFQGMNTDSGEFVAIKQMKVNKKSVMKEVMEEIRLLKKLKHQHIVRYIASTESHGFLYIIMEYMESGSLLNIVKKFNHLNESLSAKYIHQVLDGLTFIHDQGIVHRDIKAANILVAKDGSVKIADFGVSVQMNGNEKQETGNDEDPIGTPNWMAPEVIQMQGTTVKADIWALGCTVIELITGNPPYYDLNPTAALYKIVNDDYPPFPNTVSPQLREFLFSCFKRDPNQRASSRDLLKHKWFITNGIKIEESKKPTFIKALSTTNIKVNLTKKQQNENEDWAEGFILKPPRMREVRTFTARKSTEDDWGEYFIIPNEGINIGKINENNTDNEYKSMCLEDIDLLESEDDERKEQFIKQMKEIGKMIEIGGRDNNKIFQILLQLHNIVLNINIKQLQACVHIIGLFPLFAILEKEEYSGCLQLRLTSLQIINTVLTKDNTSKMNIVMSGCVAIVKFGITHYKSNDLYLNEIVKFIKCIIHNETNKNELQQMFITSGGLELIYLILTMKYDDKHKGNMNVVLEIVNRIVQSQRDIKTRMEFCSRNITTMIFIQYKLIDGLLEFICQTFSLKQYTPALKAITIIILIIDSIMRNDTQIKFIVCQRIISTDLIGILSRTMDTSINSKLNEFVQEDVLFNVCKLCKLLISDTEKEIIYGLFNTKLIFFIVKVLLRCDSLDKELKNCCLINMMKNGLINNVIQCLNILCTSSIIGHKVCLELSSIPNIFLLLKSYCDKGKSNFVMVEEDCLNIILTIAGSITKQQSSSDFILHNALEFLLEYCSKKGIVAHLFSAFRALYQARPKKGLKILGDVKSIVLICNIFNLSNYNDGMCCSELKEFCAIINEHEELIKLYSESTFVYGTASLLRQVVNIEAKKYFAVLMKSLLLNNTHLYNLIMKDKIIIYLNETYTECMENGKEVVGKIVEECLSLVMNASPKHISKKEEQKIIEKLKKEEELKQKLKKENDKFLHQKKENRKGVSFGKPGSNQMLEKALSGEFVEESKQKRSASFTPTQANKNEDLHLSFPVKAIPHLASHSQPSTPSQKSSRKLFSFGKKEEKY
ncbi:hypothetical protein ENUP19_0263G0006 [Entamoeba nuttalli]|uniref:non-specific serine/threonine protein kinase n=1 Tax=Entamoeba nuttalli TaxID=412467 RepID=A0ABQ0DSF3_9EUKA